MKNEETNVVPAANRDTGDIGPTTCCLGLVYNRVLILYNGIRQEGQQWGDEHGIEVDAYCLQSFSDSEL